MQIYQERRGAPGSWANSPGGCPSPMARSPGVLSERASGCPILGYGSTPGGAAGHPLHGRGHDGRTPHKL
ncbi:UNVERIFIED_CONTAM: hypothetical protein Sradi_1514600 [Sesamum radiatum]|uniref:Uncharacterized protein n=1 Tax=Sesamum radiatum TaxID=300843 RepID=A0AAW2U825_SESRA